MLIVFLYLGTILTIAGILASSQVRFEGRILLPEGEFFNGDAGGYLEGSVYSGKLATPPATGLRLLNLEPSLRKGRTRVWNIRGDFSLGNQPGSAERHLKVNSIFPSFANGVFYRIRSFGYAPHYRLTDKTGKILDEAYPMLRLFPPGVEDSFRLEKLPQTFYLKYYPDGSMIRDTSLPIPQEARGSLYKLRVTRNLDVVFNGYIVPGEIYQAEALYISIDEIRRWAEIEIINDYGLFLMIPGIGIFFAAFVLARLRGVNLLKEMFSPLSKISASQ